ncbi:MAG: oligosaccharide flippase family protein [Spongiibacteraceae bacterium]
MSITHRVFASSAFQVAINIMQRLIGVVSTLILARLLTPNDFGIIAILAITIHLTDILSDAGSQQYIIQKQDTDDDDLNTSWTIDIIGKCTLTLVICLLAPAIANTLDNPLLTDAIRLIALSIPLRALRNPGLILLAKELQYQKLFKLNLYQKLLSFAAVMLVVVIHPSYWAIIAGDIVAAAILLIGSYQVHSFRPQLTLQRFKQQWAFSQWSLLRGITGFLRSQADILIVSKLFPTGKLGGYHLQRELALIPALSLVIPAIEPLMTAIAKAKYDTELLGYRIRLSLLTLFTLLFPLSVFIFLQSELIVTVLLGKQWIPQHQLLAYFSLMFFAFCLHALISDCFTAIDRLKTLFFFDLLSTVVIIAVLLAAMHTDLNTFALIRGGAGLIITASLLLLLNVLIQFKLTTLLINCIAPLAAGLMAFLVNQQLNAAIPASPWALIDLGLATIIYFGSYSIVFLLLANLLCQLAKTQSEPLEETEQLLHNMYSVANALKRRLKFE